MRARPWTTLSMLVVMGCIGTGCGSEDSGPGSDDQGATTPDPFGNCMGGKCDEINPENDPSNLGFFIDYQLADESMVGQTLVSTLIPYSPPTYFPFTSDGINNRHGTASPAEKYDQAFSNWTPDEAFWSLKKLSGTSDTEFDQAYYDQLGPVATWEHFDHGLGRLHDGVDNDGDGQLDLEDTDNEGLEGWFGYCNGNTAASLSVQGPKHPADWNGVTFAEYDIMALLGAVYYGDRSTMTGLRCESLHPAKDEFGRYVNQPWFKYGESEPMQSFDILQGPASLGYDKVGYLVQLEVDGEVTKALIRLPFDAFKEYRKEIKEGEITFDNEEWKPVSFSVAGAGCRDTNPGTLYLAVTNLLGKYKIPFGIDADSGSHVWNYPIYEAVIREQKLVEKTEALQLLGVEGEEYPFNANAKNFAHVKLDLTQSHGMNLEMVLELDDGNKVIGGEWVGGSKSRHPDFIWVPMGADNTGYNTEGTFMTFGDDQLDGSKRDDGSMDYNDAPDMRYSDVRRVLALSRTEANEAYNEYAGEASPLPEGQTTTLPVQVDATDAVVKNVLVYMNAKAQFTPGLKVKLVSPDGTEVNVLDVPHTNQNWPPGRFPVGWDLGELRGVAHPMPMVDDDGVLAEGLAKFNERPAAGEWKLIITNEGGGPANVEGWSLWLTTATTTP